jgi:MFS family permease
MMLGYAAVVLVGILPWLPLLHAVPKAVSAGPAVSAGRDRAVLGLSPNVVQGVICVAGFCCCVPMAIPSSHLVAFCSDIGIGPVRGAAMLSVLLGCAFISRQFWGSLADRIGGLRTVMAGSACQAAAIGAFLLTQNEAGLFVIAGVYGLGFSGIIPSYSVAIRDLFPSAEASWRIPTMLFTSMTGMAVGSWLAGRIFDHFASYAPAFATGVLFNLLNLALVGFLVMRMPRRSGPVLAPA